MRVSHLARYFTLLIKLLRNSPFRGQLPELVRLRLRRVQRHRSLDLRLEPQRRLHHHILPVRYAVALDVDGIRDKDPCSSGSERWEVTISTEKGGGIGVVTAVMLKTSICVCLISTCHDLFPPPTIRGKAV